jgi:demethylmenaquinone methyltransferase/2-methoxy-6-polyprenyl-1,4-benzoquinol methylase
VSRSILAVDASRETLEIAATKTIPPGRVRYLCDDAYELREVRGSFTAGFAGFWWSHIPRRTQARFLERFHSLLPPGAPVLLMDNRYVNGSSTPITRSDEDGNSYQRRRLADGSEHEILKNFPTPDDLESSLAPFATEIRITELPYYWCVSYRVNKSAPPGPRI